MNAISVSILIINESTHFWVIRFCIPTHTPQQFSPVAPARDFHEGITTDEQRRQTDSMQVQHVDKSNQPQLLSLIISDMSF